MREGSSHNQLPISTMDKTPLVNNETWNKPNLENLWKSQCNQAIDRMLHPCWAFSNRHSWEENLKAMMLKCNVKSSSIGSRLCAPKLGLIFSSFLMYEVLHYWHPSTWNVYYDIIWHQIVGTLEKLIFFWATKLNQFLINIVLFIYFVKINCK
jgi:hypothetical protein